MSTELSIKNYYTLCMLACGTMGSAVLSGVLDSLSTGATAASGIPIPGKFVACVKRQESADRITTTYAGKVEVALHQHAQAVASADVVILGCKPQLCEEILSGKGMKEALSGKLLISVLAGTTIKQIQDIVGPDTIVVRAMPNTPCKVLSTFSNLLFHYKSLTTTLIRFGKE